MTKTKLLDVLASKNFFTSIISIFLLILGYNNISTEITSDGVWDLIHTSKGGELIASLFALTLNTGLKIYQKIVSKTFDFSFIYSSNFQVAVMSVITLIVGAFVNEITAAIIVSVVMQVVNILIHLKSPAKN